MPKNPFFISMESPLPHSVELAYQILFEKTKEHSVMCEKHLKCAQVNETLIPFVADQADEKARVSRRAQIATLAMLLH